MGSYYNERAKPETDREAEMGLIYCRGNRWVQVQADRTRADFLNAKENKKSRKQQSQFAFQFFFFPFERMLLSSLVSMFGRRNDPLMILFTENSYYMAIKALKCSRGMEGRERWEQKKGIHTTFNRNNGKIEMSKTEWEQWDVKEGAAGGSEVSIKQ